MPHGAVPTKPVLADRDANPPVIPHSLVTAASGHRRSSKADPEPEVDIPVARSPEVALKCRFENSEQIDREPIHRDSKHRRSQPDLDGGPDDSGRRTASTVQRRPSTMKVLGSTVASVGSDCDVEDVLSHVAVLISRIGRHRPPRTTPSEIEIDRERQSTYAAKPLSSMTAPPSTTSARSRRASVDPGEAELEPLPASWRRKSASISKAC